MAESSNNSANELKASHPLALADEPRRVSIGRRSARRINDTFGIRRIALLDSHIIETSMISQHFFCFSPPVQGVDWKSSRVNLSLQFRPPSSHQTAREKLKENPNANPKQKHQTYSARLGCAVIFTFLSLNLDSFPVFVESSYSSIKKRRKFRKGEFAFRTGTASWPFEWLCLFRAGPFPYF